MSHEATPDFDPTMFDRVNRNYDHARENFAISVAKNKNKYSKSVRLCQLKTKVFF